MDSREFEARQLAAWLLAHAWDEVTILEGMRAVLGPGKLGWHRVLARELADWGANPYPPAPERIVALLLQSAFFEPKRAAVPVLEPPLFAPAAAFAGLAVPQLATPGELAAWLGLDMPVLEWLAGTRPAGTAALQHYRYALIPKRNGAARLLEAPKARLKAIQRKILHEILDPVPVHNAAHGFVRKRSCLTAAQIHAGEGVVAAFDLARFFPSIAAPRVHGLFRRLGYPSTASRCRGKYMACRICPKAPQHPPRSPTCWPGGWMHGSPAWRARRGRTTRATPMIWRSPARRLALVLLWKKLSARKGSR
jgi:hypothetical protein